MEEENVENSLANLDLPPCKFCKGEMSDLWRSERLGEVMYIVVCCNFPCKAGRRSPWESFEKAVERWETGNYVPSW